MKVSSRFVNRFWSGLFDHALIDEKFDHPKFHSRVGTAISYLGENRC